MNTMRLKNSGRLLGAALISGSFDGATLDRFTKRISAGMLVNDLGINSLELADLVLLCEERFGIEISDDDVRSFLTVQDVSEYLAKKTDKE